MIYVFTFLGEFGYELLNWQGVIRKLKQRINKDDKIVACSRKGLKSFYEYADAYVDISSLQYYQNSVATGYRSNNPQIPLIRDFDKYHDKRISSGVYSPQNLMYVKKMKEEIKKYVLGYKFDFKFNEDRVRFIFSDKCEEINGLQFGRKHRDIHNIYDKLDINNNEYVKLLPDETKRQIVENKLDMNLDTEYILCQAGSREIVQRSKELISIDNLIECISKRIQIVLMDFSTGRNLDSGSQFSSNISTKRYKCNSFEEQSVLISHAKACLFFTEGDFRSHNYLPPFMGKDVYSVADQSVFELPTTPLDFWNKNVFRFGGQIKPVVSRNLMDDSYLARLVNEIC